MDNTTQLNTVSQKPRDGQHNTTEHSIATIKRWTRRTRPPSHSQDRNHRIITSILKMLTILKTLMILRSCRWARILVCLYDDDDDDDGHHHRHHRWAWIQWGSTGLWPCPPLTTPHLPHSTQRTQYQLQYSIPNATWHAIQYQMILSQCCYNI